jgi:hypothetical protein
MFICSINRYMRCVLELAASQWRGHDVYVACSGNFTVEWIKTPTVRPVALPKASSPKPGREIPVINVGALRQRHAAVDQPGVADARSPLCGLSARAMAYLRTCAKMRSIKPRTLADIRDIRSASEVS